MPDTPQQTIGFLPPFLFPPVGWCVQVVRNPERMILLDTPFCKQTLLSRFCIKGANNPIVLTCPVVHNTRRNSVTEVHIDHRQPWNRLALKTLESAYRKAPYWEYYADDLIELLQTPPEKLLELIVQSHGLLVTWLNLPSLHYRHQLWMQPEDASRWYFTKTELKGEPYRALNPYQQTFHGFMPQVSYLDLVFNLGPRAVQYLTREAETCYGTGESN
jgi:hypothetical protein